MRKGIVYNTGEVLGVVESCLKKDCNMFSSDQYSLVDFGNGRRLERFGPLVLDRPCPGANNVCISNWQAWNKADAKFENYRDENRFNSGKNVVSPLGVRGMWRPLTDLGKYYFGEPQDKASFQNQGANKISSRPWSVSYEDKFILELRGSPFGHVGMFPEQSENWDRIFELCKRGSEQLRRPLRVLNLFGYTGGSALAAIAAGAETTHLDAARNVVSQARRNAELSFQREGKDIDLIPARWIVDDAVKFVKREIKRERFYDGVILDPPSYGHGSRGEVWRLSRDLQPLLDRVVKILSGDFCFVLLTGHTPGYDAPVLERMLKFCFNDNFSSTKEIAFCSKSLAISSQYNSSLYSGDMTLAYGTAKK